MSGEVFVMKTGGFASLFTVIEVTYPSGSICTCGGKAAKDTSGHALFPVKAGTYTVECHTSDNSKSRSTSITVAESDKGKCKSVTLKYSLDIIVNGKFNYDVIGSWGPGDSSQGLGSMVEHESDGYVQIQAPIKDSYNGTYTAWTSKKALPTSEYTTVYLDYSTILNSYSS